MRWIALIVFLIFLSMAYPSSAIPVVNNWLETVELSQNGSCDVVIQMEITGKFASLSIDVPGKQITVIKDDSMDFGGPLDITTGEGIITLTPNYFSDDTWNGRIHLKIEDIGEKTDVITYRRTFKSPVIKLENGTIIEADLKEGAISTTVALPENFTPVSYSPEPWKIIFQYGRMKVLWREIGETTVTLEGEFSPFLKDYITVSNRLRSMKALYEDNENYREARTILSLSLGYFEEGNLEKARNYLNRSLEIIEGMKMNATPENPETPEKTGERTPGFETGGAILALIFVTIIGKRWRRY